MLILFINIVIYTRFNMLFILLFYIDYCFMCHLQKALKSDSITKLFVLSLVLCTSHTLMSLALCPKLELYVNLWFRRLEFELSTVTIVL